MRNKNRIHRKRRIRAKIKGTAKRPRLAIFRSLLNISVQIINDEKGVTIFAVNSKSLKVKANIVGAKKIGDKVAEECIKNKIKEIVFDRSGYKYHGKIKAIADSVREGGIKF